MRRKLTSKSRSATRERLFSTCSGEIVAHTNSPSMTTEEDDEDNVGFFLGTLMSICSNLVFRHQSTRETKCFDSSTALETLRRITKYKDAEAKMMAQRKLRMRCSAEVH